MSSQDVAVVSSLSSELAQKSALSNFHISNPDWHYQQIVCPAFPDYVLLTFSHSLDPYGSTSFVAVLPRNSAEVRVISSSSRGVLPFESWSKPRIYDVFNHMLRQERGNQPLGTAPNWLVIGMCYAEMSGYPTQVLTAAPLPDTTLDMVRLGANRPQLNILPDKSATITFSDVSRPTLTTDWILRFDPHGQITSASHTASRQPSKIALKP